MTRADSRYLALDLGATKFAYCLSNDVSLPKPTRIEIPLLGDPNREFAIIADVLARRAISFQGTAVVCVAPSVDDAGIVTSWPNRPYWRDFPLVVQFEQLLGCAVRCIGDGEAAALADAGEDRGRAYVSLHFGTGVGGAIVVDGEIVRLGPLNAELGHIIVDPSGAPCKCGKRGCLQAEWQASRTTDEALDGLLSKLALMISNLAQILPACQITLGGRLLETRQDATDCVRREVNAILDRSAWTPAIRSSAFGSNAPLAGALREAVKLGAFGA
ncbi:putative NBD/HSP70 family sugar kinase [Bradyrhizobium sp. USDA 4524]|uniref:ROK family protein n=1 Tax=unclassified Bradyrhizobium TaxID=2631580 RepID=UPI00209DD9DF|nr:MULTISPECIES: ROK family protein [unclassified Bradyrhizobium]MCP1845974.1 kanosamine 6-kinase [Bradyrhizobium sp. USDA 4538]MCP1907392.1 kanosamine 6-kinase [Bradyrhizobium sp. USDA 4537]MCP1985178.1 kanosamine 6-kinase [Bradyrhizobium sp. USDA 4539]